MAGLNADLTRYLLLILLALTVVVGIQAVGVVLVSGLLITPAAAASLLTTRLQLDPNGKPHIPGSVEVWKDGVRVV